MTKKVLIFIAFFSFLFTDYIIFETNDYKNFYKTPVLHDGRIKPLGVLAGEIFKLVSHDKKESIRWFAELLFDPTSLYNNDTFFISNKELVVNFGLPNKEKYSLFEILYSFKKNFDFLIELKSLNKDVLSNSQKNMIEIYFNISLIFDIGKSMDLISKNNQNLDLRNSVGLKIIPLSDNIWVSLHDHFNLNNCEKTEEFNELSILQAHYKNKNLKFWNKEYKNFDTLVREKLSLKSRLILKLEILYSNLNLIYKSYLSYLTCFILIICSRFNLRFKSIVMPVMFFGFILNFFDILFRIIITGKAPVTSLYESIIFVNFIFVFCFIILCIRKKKYDNIFLISTFLAFLLNFIATKFGIDSNIKSVMAVLNTNLWLVIHVLTISVGYGLCLISGFLGHVYLFYFIKEHGNSKFLQILYNLMFSFTLIALFFTFIGTLLGGVWADQSWGRFWGWDPKENGALLIVLWLTLILHAKVANLISDMFFGIGLVLNVIVLFLAWFGVNLLNVGLHSYGFVENIGNNLLIFSFFELMYILIFFYMYKKTKIKFN